MVRRRGRERMDVNERRKQIIDVATQLIAERGYWGTSLQDVADECDLTVAGLVHHVQSKTGLLMMILEQEDQDSINEVSSALGITAADLEEQNVPFPLLTMCNAIVDYNARNPEKVRLYCILNAEALDSEHPAYALLKAREEKTLRVFTSFARHETENPEAVARLLLSMMDGLQLQWLRDPQSMDFAREWRRLVAATPTIASMVSAQNSH